MKNYITVNWDQGFLLPPNIRDWVPKDSIAFFITELVKSVPLELFEDKTKKNTGRPQIHPHVMLAAVVFCYVHNITTLRKMEEATKVDTRLRFITGGIEIDHSTYGIFINKYKDAIKEFGVQVMLIGVEEGHLTVEDVSTDGTTIKSNASVKRNITFSDAKEQIVRLEEELKELTEKAYALFERLTEGGQAEEEEITNLFHDIKRKKKLLNDTITAIRHLEEQARREAEYEAQKGKKDHGEQCESASDAKPKDDAKVNLTDPDSKSMPRKGGGFLQGVNWQFVVDVKGSYFILSSRMAKNSSDTNELVNNIQSIDPRLGKPLRVLADAGYVSCSQILQLIAKGCEPFIAVRSKLSEIKNKKEKKFVSKVLVEMDEKMKKEESKEFYKLRGQTAETVIGTIKQNKGCTQIRRRGKEKIENEMNLITSACNVKRLHNLKTGVQHKREKRPVTLDELKDLVMPHRSAQLVFDEFAV